MMVTAKYGSFPRVSFHNFLWQHNSFDCWVTSLPVLAVMLFFPAITFISSKLPPFCINTTFGQVNFVIVSHLRHLLSSILNWISVVKILIQLKMSNTSARGENSVVKIAYFFCRGPGFSSQWKTLGGSSGPVAPVPGDLLALVHTLCT